MGQRPSKKVMAIEFYASTGQAVERALEGEELVTYLAKEQQNHLDEEARRSELAKHGAALDTQMEALRVELATFEATLGANALQNKSMIVKLGKALLAVWSHQPTNGNGNGHTNGTGGRK